MLCLFCRSTNIMKRLRYTLLTCLLVPLFVFSQGYDQALNTGFEWDTITPPLNHGFITLGLGYGLSSFHGDLAQDQKLTSFNNFKSAFTFSLERRFGKVIGVSAYASMGKLSQFERSIGQNRNFEAPFYQFGVNLQGHFDWSSTTRFAPFISVGASYMMFENYGDLYNQNNQEYHYWSDGTIRDLPEYDSEGNYLEDNESLSEFIYRDFDYETKYTTTSDPDSISNYSKSSLVLPFTLGFKFRLSEFLEARIWGTYNYTTTDYIDNYVAGSPDAYVYAGASLHYTIGKKWLHPVEQIYSDVDFNEIVKKDTDNDGIADFKDNCAHTPKSAKVAEDGCPIDSDKDGVPDYRDDEKGSSPGSHVNYRGVALTEADIAKQDSIFKGIYFQISKKITAIIDTLRLQDQPLTAAQIKSIMKEFEAPTASRALPQEFWFADINNDGILQVDEITWSIDCYFEGDEDACPNNSVSLILDMIDFFFGQ